LREIQEEEMLQKKVSNAMKSAPPAAIKETKAQATQPQFAQYPTWDAFQAPAKSFKEIQEEQQRETARLEEERRIQVNQSFSSQLIRLKFVH
jgi:adenylosuccinate synthase